MLWLAFVARRQARSDGNRRARRIPRALRAPLLAILGMSLDILESASLACFAGLIGYMAGITGGMHSPLIVWFALVPRKRHSGGRNASCAPPCRLTGSARSPRSNRCTDSAVALVAPAWQIYAGSVLAAIVQSASSPSPRRTAARSDLAAAEGAAMYRFLADNATT